jgi:hypothetical protein
VEIPVALLPEFLVLSLPFQHLLSITPSLRGNHAAFPVQIAGIERLFERMIFKQEAQFGDMPEVRG